MKQAEVPDFRRHRIRFARITSKQVRAIILILAMLFPTAAPVPAWAYDLELPVASMTTEPSTQATGEPWIYRLSTGVATVLGSIASLLPTAPISTNRRSKETVGPPAASRVRGIKTELTREIQTTVGKALSLAALPTDKREEIVDGILPTWTTSDASIVRIENQSEAIARGAGKATLTVEAGGVRRAFQVIVTEAEEKSAIQQSTERVGAVSAPPPPPTEEAFINGLFSAQNNLGKPPGQVEAEARSVAAATRTKERAGGSNFSFDVPVVSLPGRGIHASVGITYNSRLWTKITRPSPQPHHYYYNVDRNWALAPGFMLGYGHLDNYVAGSAYRFALVSADGTRTELSLKSTTGGLRTYESTDGTFAQMKVATGSEPSDPTLEVKHPDGTVVIFGAKKPDYLDGIANQGRRFPIKIIDRNGNTISISYLQNDTFGKIATITDTLGRFINFEYDNTPDKHLVAITVPPLVESAPRRQVVRFYYAVLNFHEGNRFSDGEWVYHSFDPPTALVLQYVYFPGTASGYRYDYSSPWGTIYRISSLRGMHVEHLLLDSTGSVDNDGQVAATTTYDYPLNLTGPNQPAPLTDVPKFTTRTDDWLGRTTPTAPVTTFSVVKNTTDSRTETRITSPDGTISESWSKIAEDWENGLVTDTFIKTPLPQLPDTVWSHTKMTWQNQAGSTGRGNPRVTKVEHTNDAGQTRATTIEYDNYNNPTIVREFDYGASPTIGNEIRKTQIDYETAAAWTGRYLLSLPSIVKSWTAAVLSSRSKYEYDASAMEDYDEEIIAQLDPRFNINAPEYESWTNYRGNVTKVESWANPPDDYDPNKAVNDFDYDITGNVVEATLSCCNVKKLEYSEANNFAYVTREINGTAPLQLTTETDYNFRTGLPVEEQDENARSTVYTYDAATTRQTRIDVANGAWSTAEFNDSTFPYHIRTTGSLDSTRSISSWSFFNGAGQAFRSRSQTAGGYLSGDTEFDSVGRAVKSFNPYTVSGLLDERPTGIKSTEALSIDPLSRVLTTRFQDDTTATIAFSTQATTPSGFNKTFATVTDQAGKQRRQLADALGRIVRVDEPIANPPDGNPLGPVATPHQPTHYEFDGNDNLTKVTQSIPGGVTQERVFKYDSLSRLSHERQVEAIPTLNDIGEKVPSGGLWTGFYKYTTDGLLDYGVDSRGVKTDFTYDGLNRVKEVEYFNEVGYTTPKVIYTYGESETGFFNIGRLTRVQTAVVAGQTFATEQNYDYDSVGQVKKHVQTINGESYQLEYGYNLAGQLISEKYPSGKIVNMTVDNFGVVQTVADSQRTYVNGVTFAYTASGITSQMTLGNGTTESFTMNERFQMTSQSLMKGAEVLKKYDYSYGEVNVATGDVLTSKNNGQLGKIEGWIGANKQWSQRFGYDELGRLSEAREYKQGDNTQLTYKQKFEFDRFGNLYRKAANNPTTGQQNPLPYTPIEDADIHKATNRFATGTTYDEAGQVTQDNKFRSMGFSYDANGRVVKATKTSTPDAHTVYDALGNRVATKINDVWQYIVYNAFGKLVAEYGLATQGAGGVKYIQQDWQGSVRTVTNSNGFVVSRTDHQAFGEAISSGIGLRNVNQGYGVDASTRQGYGLTEGDTASGQQHTWFRKLEPQAGRWSSPDPYIGSISLADPQSFSRNSYVRNDPTNFVDPSGLMPQSCSLNEQGDVVCNGGGGWLPGQRSVWNGGLNAWNYQDASVNYETARAMAGGFFGEHIRGFLERTWSDTRVGAKERLVSAIYFYFTPSFGGFFGGGRGRGGTPSTETYWECVRNAFGRHVKGFLTNTVTGEIGKGLVVGGVLLGRFFKGHAGRVPANNLPGGSTILGLSSVKETAVTPGGLIAAGLYSIGNSVVSQHNLTRSSGEEVERCKRLR